MAGIEGLINGWFDDVAVGIGKVHKKSFADVMGEANTSKEEGGLMPVDTGALQDSIAVGSDYGVAQGRTHYQTAIQGASLGSPLVGTWGDIEVNYAVFVEFGTRFQAAQPFARTALLNWQSYVRRNVALL